MVTAVPGAALVTDQFTPRWREPEENLLSALGAGAHFTASKEMWWRRESQESELHWAPRALGTLCPRGHGT